MAKKKNLIQRVETWRYDLPLHCPLCGAKAIDPESDSDPTGDLCKHVLFLAHDEGFELRTDRFNALMNIQGVDDDEVDLGDKGYDGFTDRVGIRECDQICYLHSSPIIFWGLYWIRSN